MCRGLLLVLLGFAGLSFEAAAVDIRLVDSRTGNSIAGAEVHVGSDNGISCIFGPCPADFREWNGRSDSSGILSVPATAFNVDTRFHVPGFEATGSLPRAAAGASQWQVELDAKDSMTLDGMRIDRVKLIDKSTARPLADVTFWIASSRKCRSRTCADILLSGTTNGLGNAFVPLARIPHLEQRMWIGVEGHQAVEYWRSPDLIVVLPQGSSRR